jgi:hypothetical protein
MPVEFRTPSPSPAKVHEHARRLIKHHPCWLKRPYKSGLFYIEHFRTCSYCLCIHPLDMIELLEAGGSRLEASGKVGKLYFVTPNPIAGELVRMGSVAGPIFSGTTTYFPSHRRVTAPTRDLDFEPTPSERLSGHFERSLFEPAPEYVRWPFYSEHTCERQWPEIAEAAATGGQQCVVFKRLTT